MNKSLIAAVLIALAGSAMAQDSMKVIRLNPDGLTWKDNPNIPQGAQFTILLGDPTKVETNVQRHRFPPNYKAPLHTHPYAEIITVISGRIGLGVGEKFEAKESDMGTVGAFYVLPANQVHYIWTGNEGATIQVQFVGPGGIVYVNPADDPRKK